ncbi:shikimate kinase [Xanthomonas cannabis]|uniref:shikimate kinase n=1 Tax=Xanthomonas cannabis TaxID=1885674 RepID=UPI0005743ACB|nr:shikimate kinase [Xanthomonas cannabis]KHL52204.1 shikimate kinase [Xanthomonas cannabis pv. cannabis]KHL52242.1 shikimate kinase [Xanthomonas cannabis pv. cannabis]MCC4612222.1 shikimate kinase [Xanthomonas campestris pv. esculenti]MCC8441222.1 shikimate kinase [Xanthomonas cannabis]
MNPAPNLVMVGPMGAGKSCIGRRLAERFGLDFVDVDQAIVDHVGSSIAAIFEQHGEARFREHEAQTLQALLQQDNKLISTGGGAVLDPLNRERIRARGFVVYLHVSVPAQLTRLARDRNRPLLQRADREQVLHTMAAHRTPLYQDVADLTLETDHFSPAEATAQLVLRLAAQWRMSSTPA